MDSGDLVHESHLIIEIIYTVLLGWNGTFVGKKRKDVWKASPLCLFWTVWKTRNKVAFEEEELSIQRLKSSFVYFLWSENEVVYKIWSLDLS